MKSPRKSSLALATAMLTGAAALGLASFATGSPSAVQLKATPAVVTMGQSVTLSGAAKAGASVSVLTQPCKFNVPVEITKVRASAGGRFSFRLQPLTNTKVVVAVDGVRSKVVALAVLPRITLKRVAAGRYSVDVTTTNPLFLNGKRVAFQRRVGSRWVNVAQVTLRKNSPEIAMESVSSATFKASVPAGATVRATIPASQLACYRAASSAPIAG